MAHCQPKQTFAQAVTSVERPFQTYLEEIRWRVAHLPGRAVPWRCLKTCRQRSLGTSSRKVPVEESLMRSGSPTFCVMMLRPGLRVRGGQQGVNRTGSGGGAVVGRRPISYPGISSPSHTSWPWNRRGSGRNTSSHCHRPWSGRGSVSGGGRTCHRQSPSNGTERRSGGYPRRGSEVTRWPRRRLPH